MAVRSGVNGTLTLNIAGGGAVALNTRSLDITEQVTHQDTSSTGSTVTNGVIQTTVISTAAQTTVNARAQYSAGGAGDPPDFSAGKLYNNIPVVAQAGDTVSGNFKVSQYRNSFSDVAAVIEYDLSLRSNGAVTRSTGS